ncbi:MAG TPA: hypothetical protein DD618_03625, partial [Acholeplasmatales bacterium]|nr:hypothetical protein [Acholeplasmatales bacterium]
PDSELALIQSDYEKYSSMGSKSPIYRKCDLKVTIEDQVYEIDEVGIRMKGNTSRTAFYSSVTGMYDIIHYKLSFQETFDDEDYYEIPKVWADDALRDERKDRTFAGMAKLDLKWNKNFDQSHIREYWAYEMISSYGLLAPKLNLAEVLMNNLGVMESLGVYTVIENVDDYFLEKRLAEKHLGGDLYKVSWANGYGGEMTTRTLDGIGIEDEDVPEFYTYDLKTNKKTSQNAQLIAMLEAVNDDESDLNTVINMDYFLFYEAACYLIGNPDDMRNHYNNYYLYFLKDTGKAIFIPYDFDRVFGITKDWDPSGDGMTSYDPFTKMTTMGGINDQVNPLILRTIASGGDAGCRGIYQDALSEMMDGKYFQIAEFSAVYEIAKANYETELVPSVEELSWAYANFSLNDNFNRDIEDYFIEKTATAEPYLED